MGDPLWNNQGSWSEERPTALSEEGLALVLEQGGPHQDIFSFFGRVMQQIGQETVHTDPVDELARRVSVARYRGRHVFLELTSTLLIEAAHLSNEDFQRYHAQARQLLDLPDQAARTMLDRLALLQSAFELAEGGELDRQLVPLIGRLLDPTGVEFADLPDLDPAIREEIRAVQSALPGLGERSPALSKALRLALRGFASGEES